MYKFRYQIKRLRNMFGGWKRITKLYLFDNHFAFDWRMNDYKDTQVGRPYTYLMEYGDPEHPKWCRPMRDDQGNEVRVPRDFYDQVMDTIFDIVRFYWREVFVEDTCSHPHEDVRIEWDGDEEYGHFSQHRCGRCGGYMLDTTEVDRYLPPEQRQPGSIKGNPINPYDRPEAVARRLQEEKYNQRLEDQSEDMFFSEDYLD